MKNDSLFAMPYAAAVNTVFTDLSDLLSPATKAMLSEMMVNPQGTHHTVYANVLDSDSTYRKLTIKDYGFTAAGLRHAPDNAIISKHPYTAELDRRQRTHGTTVGFAFIKAKQDKSDDTYRIVYFIRRENRH